MGHFTVVFALIWWPEIESEIWLNLNLDCGFLFVEFLVGLCSHTWISAASLTQSFVLWIQHGLPGLFTSRYHRRDLGFLFTGLGSLFRAFRVFLCIDLSLISWSLRKLSRMGRVLPLCIYHQNCSVLDSGPFPLRGEATGHLSRNPVLSARLSLWNALLWRVFLLRSFKGLLWWSLFMMLPRIFSRYSTPL